MKKTVDAYNMGTKWIDDLKCDEEVKKIIRENFAIVQDEFVKLNKEIDDLYQDAAGSSI